MICMYCQEAMEDSSQHPECTFRSIMGSLAHLQRRCSCFVPGSEEGDPPHLSKRQAAILAFNYYKQHPDNMPNN